MKKKIKLRDITPEQWEEIFPNYCKGSKSCDVSCPLLLVNCGVNHRSWVYNKWLLSGLDQEIEVEE